MRRFRVVCKACRRWFRLPVVGDAFARPILGDAEWACPRCGERRSYGPRDYSMEPARRLYSMEVGSP